MTERTGTCHCNLLILKTDTEIQGWNALAQRADKKNVLENPASVGAVVTETE